VKLASPITIRSSFRRKHKIFLSRTAPDSFYRLVLPYCRLIPPNAMYPSSATDAAAATAVCCCRNCARVHIRHHARLGNVLGHVALVACWDHGQYRYNTAILSLFLIGPILWGYSGLLCHALSSLLLLLWTSILHCHSPGVATVARRLLILVVVSTVATPGEWQCKIRTGGVRRLAVANGPNIFQMLLVAKIRQCAGPFQNYCKITNNKCYSTC